MVGGFNHNFSYKGQTYHVQTEDSGVPRARITTLLYRAGSIIARETTDYSSICPEDDLASKVEELMKEQHRSMLKSLKAGEFDAKIARFDAASNVASDIKDIKSGAEVELEGSEVSEEILEESRPSPSDSESEVRGRRLEERVKAYLEAGR